MFLSFVRTIQSISILRTDLKHITEGFHVGAGLGQSCRNLDAAEAFVNEEN
jgi:hypothetical protein